MKLATRLGLTLAIMTFAACGGKQTQPAQPGAPGTEGAAAPAAQAAAPAPAPAAPQRVIPTTPQPAPEESQDKKEPGPSAPLFGADEKPRFEVEEDVLDIPSFLKDR